MNVDTWRWCGCVKIIPVSNISIYVYEQKISFVEEWMPLFIDDVIKNIKKIMI